MPTVVKTMTQEGRVLEVLTQASEGKIEHSLIKNGWVNKQYFVRVMFFTQAARAIHNLEHEWGVKIEHSDFTDDFGFKSYRLALIDTLF